MKLVFQRSDEIDCTKFGELIDVDRLDKPGKVTLYFANGAIIICKQEDVLRCRFRLAPELRNTLKQSFAEFMAKNTGNKVAEDYGIKFFS